MKNDIKGDFKLHPFSKPRLYTHKTLSATKPFNMSHHQAFELDTKISFGSRILVTGAAGLIGSAVVHQLLLQNFVVRATTRTASKLEQLKKKVDEEFGTGRIEVVEIKDLSIEGALDGSLNGRS